MDPYIGEIRAFAGNYAPEGWALCAGQALSVNDNQELYSLLGTAYGGDGVNTFNLPNLCGRTPVSAGQAPGMQNYTLGQSFGVENVTLQTTELPSHSHLLNVSSANGTSNSPSNNFLAAPVDAAGAKNLAMYLSGSQSPLTTVALQSTSMSNSGASQPHNNLMPFVTINYIISLSGIYPTID